MSTEVILGCLSGASAVVLGVWKYLPKYQIAVNCWFCQADFRVPFKQRNCFTCPDCQQYNGFNDDGDYNRTNPDWFRDIPSKKPPTEEPDNGLCRTCNLNQGLKVHQLAKFEPRNPKTFDKEVEEFSRHLERTYRLCRECEATLHQALGEQDVTLKSKLLSWKLDRNKSRLSNSRSTSNSHLNYRAGAKNLSFLVRLFVCLMALFFLLLQVDTERHRSPNLVNVTGHFETSLNEQFLETAKIVQDRMEPLELVFATVAVLLASNLVLRVSLIHLINTLCWIGTLVLLLIAQIMQIPALPLLPIALVTFVLSASNLTFAKEKNLKKKKSTRKAQEIKYPETMVDFCKQQLVVNRDEAGEARADVDARSKVHERLETTQNTQGSRNVDTSYDYPCDISTLSIDDDDEEEELAHLMTFSTLPTTAKKRVNGSQFIASRQQFTPLLRPARFIPSKKVAKTSWVAGGYWQNVPNSVSASKDDNSRSSSVASSGFVSNTSTNGIFRENNLLPLPPAGPRTSSIFSGSNHNNSRTSSNCGDFQNPHQQSTILSEQPPVVFSHANISKRSHFDKRRKNLLDDSLSLGDAEQFEFSLMGQDLPKPRAESSPIISPETTNSLLSKQITFKCSVYSIVLGLSVGANLLLLFLFYL